MAFVSLSAGSEQSLKIISSPGHAEGFLAAPGAGLVIEAHEAGEIQISVRKRTPGGSFNASFQLEPVNAIELAAAEPVPQGISMVAHLSRRGDVQISDGEWAGGPQSPTPIEGIEIRCGFRNLDVEGQVLVGGEWSAWQSSQSYLGTRGRALPLTGIRLRLSGTASARSVLEADALFLGSPIVSKQGSSVELLSYSGSDPMVGLRIRVQDSSRPAASEASGHADIKTPNVRVFRAVG